jgi:hypothetical protein
MQNPPQGLAGGTSRDGVHKFHVTRHFERGQLRSQERDPFFGCQCRSWFQCDDGADNFSQNRIGFAHHNGVRNGRVAKQHLFHIAGANLLPADARLPLATQPGWIAVLADGRFTNSSAFRQNCSYKAATLRRPGP